MEMRPPAKIPIARKARTRAGEPPEEKNPPWLVVGVDEALGELLDVDAGEDEDDIVSVVVIGSKERLS